MQRLTCIIHPIESKIWLPCAEDIVIRLKLSYKILLKIWLRNQSSWVIMREQRERERERFAPGMMPMKEIHYI